MFLFIPINESMLFQLSKVTDENGKIKAQNTKMRKRLENLQRRQDYKASKPTLEMVISYCMNAME